MRFNTLGQEAEPGTHTHTQKGPGGAEVPTCGSWKVPLNVRDTSNRIESSFVLFSCDALLRGAPRSPTYPDSRSLGRLPPAATTCSRRNKPAPQRGDSRTRGLGSACEGPEDPRGAGYSGSPHPPRCTCSLRSAAPSSATPLRLPRPHHSRPWLASRSGPPAKRGPRWAVPRTRESLTRKRLLGPQCSSPRSARLLKAAMPPTRSL